MPLTYADLPGTTTRAASFNNPVTTIIVNASTVGWMNFKLEFYIGSTDLAPDDNTVHWLLHTNAGHCANLAPCAAIISLLHAVTRHTLLADLQDG
jgi:hypothetical protein